MKFISTVGILVVLAFNAGALPGDLDTTFGGGGGGGYVVSDLEAAQTDEDAFDAAVQSDGKIVIVGRRLNTITGFRDFLVARINPNGTLDPTFDGDGFMTLAGSLSSNANAVAIQTDGKIVVAGGNGTTTSTATVFRLNTDGSLDTGFSGDGIQTVTTAGEAPAVALQTDGKIVFAAAFEDLAFPVNSRSVIVRLNSDGSLDTTFDGDGRLIASPSIWFPYGLAVQTDGKIVAAGRNSSNATFHDVSVIRVNPNGTFDTAFDGDGIVNTVVPGAESEARGLTVQTDGKIVAVGGADVVAEDALIVRYQSDGSLDTSFDGDGYRVIELRNDNEDVFFRDIVQQADGKLIAVADASSVFSFFATGDFFVVRLNSNGATDNSFDYNGVARSQWCEDGRELALQADGRIVAVGSQSRPGSATNDGVCVQRFNTDGSVDLNFNPVTPDGRAVIPTAGFNEIEAVAGLPDGKILVAGWGTDGGGITSARLIRLNANGSLDTGFMDEGSYVRDTNSPTNPSRFHFLKVLGDGSFYVAGEEGGATIVRFTSAGVPDTAFSSDGVVTTGSATRFYGLALQSDGKVVGCGSLGTTSFAGRVIRFSATGLQETNIANSLGGSVGNNEILGCGLQADGKLVVGGYSFDGTSFTVAVSRHLTTLGIDTSFGTSGVTRTDLAASLDDRVTDLVVQPDGKIVVTSSGLNGGGHRDFAILRYDANGTLDPSFTEEFGTGGIALLDFILGAPDDDANAILLQPDGQFLVGGSTFSGADGRFGIAKLNAGGSPALGFGTLGRVRTAFPNNDASVKALAFYLNNRVIAAGRTWNGTSYSFALARYENELIPTSAELFISGRVLTAKGQGIRDATVTITDRNGESRSVRTGSLGTFRFDRLAAGETYLVSVSSRRFAFASPVSVVTMKESVLDLAFTAE